MTTLKNTYIESYLRCSGIDNRIVDFIMLSLEKNNYCQDCNYEHYIKNKYFNK